MSTSSFVPGNPGHEARLRIRAGGHLGQTAGMAPGHVQGNLAILPADLASDFLRFCQRNPKPCPLIGVSEPGDPFLPTLGVDVDIRTDLPRYRVWRDGVMTDEPTDIRALWRDDLVSFLIGCSFSFEEAMLLNGLPVRHIEQGSNPPMYRTNLMTQPAGPFHGPVVVSMRPMKTAEAIRAIEVTSRFPSVHGSPVHFGNPAEIGIADLYSPDYGDMVEIRDGEIPVFWACGVTPQAVVAAAKPVFCITHSPGHMLITDLINARLAV
ncbi:putative hydro-lyase [Achromobacter sp. GG226]|uniref:putative hydro-lyase n=1 Tax=Verticiella alkaliphila TaxID=2779529 RepID=UPI001C0BB547|nr:putative hydro-lyase [Verticiella sp. GG226]MBU4609840.1 putative hydro-lyase [Verticiella sp. GG226]